MSRQVELTSEAYNNEASKKVELIDRVTGLEKTYGDKADILLSRTETLKSDENEPLRVARQVESFEKALHNLNNDHSALVSQLQQLGKDIENRKIGLSESEKVRQSLNEKLEVNRKTMHQREQEVHSVSSNYAAARTRVHDLNTRKYEINARRRDIENDLRHSTDDYNFSKKDYENMKRQLRKKRSIVNTCNEMLPTLEERKLDYVNVLGNLRDTIERNKKSLVDIKDDIEKQVALIVLNENVENERKTVSCQYDFIQYIIDSIIRS